MGLRPRPWNRGRSIVFVFGHPRSGTTWVARALAAALGAHCVLEPYNWNRQPGGNPHLMRFEPAGSADWRFLRILAEALDRLPPDGAPVVVKDVHALPSAPALQRAFGGAVVDLVRHPCAVALSWARLGWQPRPFERWLRGEVADRYLAPYAGHMLSQSDPWFRVGASWAATTFVMRAQFRAERGWQWASLESLRARPRPALEALLDRAGRPLDTAGRGRLAEFLAAHDRDLRPGETALDIFRRSASHPRSWADEVSPGDAASVYAAAEPFGLLDCWDRPPPPTVPPGGPRPGGPAAVPVHAAGR